MAGFQPVSRKLQVPSSWRWMIDPGQSFQPYDLFGYPREWNNAQSGVVARQFAVQPLEGERAVLVFGGLLQEWAIFVNGQQAAAGDEGFLPVEVDVTANRPSRRGQRSQGVVRALCHGRDPRRPAAGGSQRVVVRQPGAVVHGRTSVWNTARPCPLPTFTSEHPTGRT